MSKSFYNGSWIQKVLVAIDSLAGLLFAGAFNALLGTRQADIRFGRPNTTISAIVGVNRNLNYRTKVFDKFLGLIFRDKNHAVRAACYEGLLKCAETECPHG